MEGYASLFDKHLSTVWSAPNYCYRCGNSASILEVGPGGAMFFNVFEAAPENERDGPNQQAAQNAGGRVGVALLVDKYLLNKSSIDSYRNIFCDPGANVRKLLVTILRQIHDAPRIEKYIESITLDRKIASQRQTTWLVSG
jgi:hypothetical protein